MINKKGFTLVELLAVIVILAIVMLIGGTVVLPMMQKAQKSALGLEGHALTIGGNEAHIAKVMAGNNNLNPQCFSLKYLYDRGYFDKGPEDGYDGSVLLTYDNDGKSHYRYWISNGTYYYAAIDEDTTDPANAVEVEGELPEQFNNCPNYTTEGGTETPWSYRDTIEVIWYDEGDDPVVPDVPPVDLNDKDSNSTVSIGDEICLDSECFIIYSISGTTVKALAKYNVMIGSECTEQSLGTWVCYNITAANHTTYNRQDSTAIGYNTGKKRIGVMAKSKLTTNLNIYQEYINSLLGDKGTATLSLLTWGDASSIQSKPYFYTSSYWLNGGYGVYTIKAMGTMSSTSTMDAGLRPVITLDVSLINN